MSQYTQSQLDEAVRAAEREEVDLWPDNIADCEEDLGIINEEIGHMEDQLRLVREGLVVRGGDWAWRCAAALRYRRKDRASLMAHFADLRREESRRAREAKATEKVATAKRQKAIEEAAQKAKAERIAANNNAAIKEDKAVIRVLRKYIETHLGADHLEAVTEECATVQQEMRALRALAADKKE